MLGSLSSCFVYGDTDILKVNYRFKTGARRLHWTVLNTRSSRRDPTLGAGQGAQYWLALGMGMAHIHVISGHTNETYCRSKDRGYM